MDGVLVVDKPLGPTSHAVVARVRRALNVRRIGHTGTLDPLASGVLPLVVGRATRLSVLLTGTVKEYVADIRFGAATRTYDAEERVRLDPGTGGIVYLDIPPEPPGLDVERIDRALASFRGAFTQVPPPFSARKTAGVPAYTRARRNQPVEQRAVPVVVHALSLEEYGDGRATLRVTCSAGFYVRSLAHDLGERLGCGAYLESLRRTRAGEFLLEDAVPLERIEAEGPAASIRLVPLDRLLPWIPAVVLTERGAKRASHGNDLDAADIGASPGGPDGLRDTAPGSLPARVRLLDGSGALLGIAEARRVGVLHPVVILV